MRVDTDDLPSIDPNRTHLDILRDVLNLMEEHLPTREDWHQQGYRDCSVCGCPLTGPVVPGVQHSTYEHDYRKEPCAWLRAVAELQAWVRVESKLEEEQLAREFSGEPPPTSSAVLAERQACADLVRTYAKPPAWIDEGAAEGIAQAILSR